MRRSFTLFSVGIHAIVIAAALIAQVLAVGVLPTPHQPVLYDAGSTMPIDIQLPAPRRPSTAPQADSINAAPLVAPAGVAAETGRESEPTAAAPGLVSGVETAPASAVLEGIGMVGTAPPPPPPPTAPMRLHLGMKTPVKIVDVAPVYPALARTVHVQGIVVLETVLDAQGRVDSVQVLRSIPLLDQAAVDAVRQWRYTPALLNGQPVAVVMTVTVTFTLR